MCWGFDRRRARRRSWNKPTEVGDVGVDGWDDANPRIRSPTPPIIPTPTESDIMKEILSVQPGAISELRDTDNAVRVFAGVVPRRRRLCIEGIGGLVRHRHVNPVEAHKRTVLITSRVQPQTFDDVDAHDD